MCSFLGRSAAFPPPFLQGRLQMFVFMRRGAQECLPWGCGAHKSLSLVVGGGEDASIHIF